MTCCNNNQQLQELKTHPKGFALFAPEYLVPNFKQIYNVRCIPNRRFNIVMLLRKGHPINGVVGEILSRLTETGVTTHLIDTNSHSDENENLRAPRYMQMNLLRMVSSFGVLLTAAVVCVVSLSVEKSVLFWMTRQQQ